MKEFKKENKKISCSSDPSLFLFLSPCISALFFLYTLFSCFHNFDSHHVIFEEIGEMAGALSYIHGIVPVNISGLVQTVHQVQHDLGSPESRN
jgi:hypothetical protein